MHMTVFDEFRHTANGMWILHAVKIIVMQMPCVFIVDENHIHMNSQAFLLTTVCGQSIMLR